MTTQRVMLLLTLAATVLSAAAHTPDFLTLSSIAEAEVTIMSAPDNEDVSQSGDVLINEIMANPVGLAALPETEYVEIYNASQADISLSGWVFIYDGKETPIPDTTLSAGGYAVLYRAGRDITVADGALSLGLSNFPSSLANTTKTIGLKNSHGATIDEITYPNAKAAQSYERAPDGSWHLSTDASGGTPGAVNSSVASPEPPLKPDDNSQPGDVLINEVMANPVGLAALPETEYVEIYNASQTDISLSGWVFIYDGKETPLPDTTLSAGGYAVLYRAGRDITVADGALSLGLDNFPSSLANTTKTIGLKNSHGATIDEMTYPNAKAAQSYERAADGSWHLSTDASGGTPGAANSSVAPPEPPLKPDDNSQPGDVLINEVMANPTGLTMLPETEYIEIYNASQTDISLYGWGFIYDGKETPLPDTTLSAGGYAVLYRVGRDITVADGALSLGLSNFPSSLANTTKTIGLKNSHGVTIDEMTYPNAKAAQSYERAPDGSWHLSTDASGGTPGAVNSSVAPPEPPLKPEDNSQPGDVLINEVMANPTGLAALPETEYVEIYNASQTDISLYGWVFIYDGKETPLPDTTLSAGSYAVLYRAGRDITVADGALSLGLNNFPSSLANTTKTIGLKNSHGATIDEMTYPNAKAAQSYERAPDGSWHLSTDANGGTPGAANSPAPQLNPEPAPNPNDHSKPGDVLINEVMANPTGLAALPETEYVEIYNASQANISLSGWIFIYDGKETPLPDTTLSAGSYAVLYRAGRDIRVSAGALSLGLDKFPSSLANTTKTLGLKNSHGATIDEMTYPNAKAAQSYERAPNGSWHVSTDSKGGTPGAVNSPAPTSNPNPNPTPNPDPTPTPTPNPNDNSQPGDVVINEVMANPVGLSKLPETEYVEILNISNAAKSLSGWAFIYDGKETALPNVTLPKGGYAVLYRSGRDITLATNALSLGLDKFPSALANTTKTLGLKNSKGVMIDEMTYPNAKAAKSYERAPDGSWRLSTDEKGGTPGAVNSSIAQPEPEPNPEPNPDPQPPVEPEDNSQPGDVLINEVMANPVGLTALPETEYVEILNASDSVILLNSWIFIYDGKETALPDTAVSTGGYVVLYRSGRDITVADGALSLGLDKFPSALANTTKTLGLKNSKGAMIDEMTYPNAKAAQSYERAPDGSWHLSTDEKGGTPGAVNSPAEQPEPEPTPNPLPGNGNDVKIEPYEIIINEIMAEPFADGSEYIELYNRSGRSLPLSGLAVATRKSDGSLGTHYPLSAITGTLAPDCYAVLARQYAGVTDFYAVASPEAVYELRLPALSNESASIVLYRASDQTIIDEVGYSSKWHDSSIKSHKGVSLERINPKRDSQDPANWTSATAEVGYGTPTSKNSQHKNGATDNRLSIGAPEYAPGLDYYTIAYQTDKTGYRCRAEIYSTNGVKIASIMNNQLLTQEGEIRWDGTGTNNSRLAPGIYLFYAELYHPDGDYKSVKKAFLVK